MPEPCASLDPIEITPLEGSLSTFTAFVSGFDDGGNLKVALPGRLDGGMRVRINAGEKYSASGRVLSSVAEDGHHFATICIDQDERRSSQRIAVNTKARVVPLHTTMIGEADGRVTDVSRTGIGLFTDISISSGTLIKIVMDGAIVFAEVRHCTRLNATGHYKVGAQIETVIFRSESEPGWVFTPRALWGALALAVRKLRHRAP